MKKMVPMLILLSLFVTLLAEPVTMQTARELANNWYINRSGHTNYSLSNAFSSPDAQNPAVYVFNYAEGGFVIVAADDASYPVLAYSTTDSAPQDANQPGAKWLSDMYIKQIEAIRAANTGNEETIAIWEQMLSNNFSNFEFTRDVSPLVTTIWNQDYPYNGDCPNDASGPGGHVYAGCGATTMGQIMRYWQHPETGTGTHSYNHPDYGTISADFGSTTYNWSSMPNSISSYDSDIAELLFHCGVAVDMDYSPDGSGSNSLDTQYAFPTYFGYQNSIQLVHKDSYSDAVWNNLMISELDDGHPVFYAGYGDYGHAFVLDGYQGSSYFHFNFGWSGSYNGYYYLNDLSPGYYDFTDDQEALIGIEPSDGPSDGDPPTNLTATVVNDVDVELTWQAPTGEPGELRWDDGINYNGIGTNAAADFDVAIRFDTDDLASFNGLSLTEVSFFPRYEDCDYTIKVWTGGSCNGSSASDGDLVAEQEVTNVVINTWNTVVLDDPVTIDSSEELWFGYNCDTQGDHPAGCAEGPAVLWKGDLINLGGWTSLATEYPSLDYNWNIVGYASYGRILSQGATRTDRDLTGYKIYRDGNVVQQINGTNTLTWTDEGLEDGEFTYWVTAVYNGSDESIPSNTATVLISGNYPAPVNLTYNIIGDDVHLDWDAPNGGDVEAVDFIEEGFEDGYLPANWQVYDADGDEICWEIAPNGFTPNSGDFCMASASYINEIGALTPNNWLVTPAVNLYDNAYMAFYISAQDASWPAEHLEVRLSTSSSQMIDFTELIYEETLQNDNWHQVYLDLSDYAGETVYIAFVHNEVTDMYWLKLDDVFVSSPVRSLGEPRFATSDRSLKNDGIARLSAAMPNTRTDRNRPEIIRYNIYRDYIIIDTQNNPGITGYIDYNVPGGVYQYFITAVYEGNFESGMSNMATVVDNDQNDVPGVTTMLMGNHPNPFNPVTQIDFSLEKAADVTIEVFNLKGQLVKTLLNEHREIGNHNVRWTGEDNDGKPVGSGIYFYKMKAGRYTATKKMILLK